MLIGNKIPSMQVGIATVPVSYRNTEKMKFKSVALLGLINLTLLRRISSAVKIHKSSTHVVQSF